MSEVTFANFTGNKAIFTGGAIFADDASTTLLAGEFNHSVAQARFRSCFLTFGEELRQMPVSHHSFIVPIIYAHIHSCRGLLLSFGLLY